MMSALQSSPTLRAHTLIQQNITSIKGRLETARTEAVTGQVVDVGRAVNGNTAKVNLLSEAIAYADDRKNVLDFDPMTLESTLVPGVHVLGDACANGDMPKSGFSANSQAKVCAQAVLAAMTGKKAFPPRFRNTCWSLVGDEYGIKVGANYKAGDGKIEKTDGFVSQVGEDDETHAATAAEGFGWYEAMTDDIFG